MIECTNQTVDVGGGGAESALGDEDAQRLFKDVSKVINQVVIPTVCAFGMVGNVLNLTILTRRKLQKSFRTLEQAANLCLISLAVSDLMFCVFVFPHMFLPTDDIYDKRGLLLDYRLYCAAVINIFIMESTLLTVAMSLERYLACCFPLRQDLYLTTRRIKYVIVFTFIFSVGFNIPVFWRYEVVTLCASNYSVSDTSANVIVDGDIGSSTNSSGLHDSGEFLNFGGLASDTSVLLENITGAVLGTGTLATGSGVVDPSKSSSLSQHVSSSHLQSSSPLISSLSSTLFSSESSPTSLPQMSQSISASASALASSISQNAASASSFSPLPSSSSSQPSTAMAAANVPNSNTHLLSKPVRYTAKQVLLMNSETVDTVYRILWAVFGNFVPLLLLFFFNVCLCRKIYKSYKMRRQFKRQAQAKSSSHVLTITLVVIVVMFFILVAPSEVVLHVSQISNSNMSPTYKTIEVVLNLMQSINFSVNFILYCIISPYFRKTLKYLMLCGCYNIYQVSHSRQSTKKDFETSLMKTFG
ncbi:uncharacterized protein LOC101853848 isoform X2 [Aplysia californica]|uniref:Uncharacterized protein LOC101853848 isoform X2 n=1 Tax=Aplysia californica TaxID=6500 RepID=A0ABM0JK83_APLCA|nr:uncharacterized protein LOC101853848 isoform X2 [Aplysia californica]